MDTQQEEYEQGVYRLEDIPKHLRKYFAPKPLFDFEGIAQELYRVTKPGGVVVWVVADATVNGSETGTSFRQALYFRDVCGFNLHDTMIYRVNGTGAKGSNYSYWQEYEFMFVLSKGKPAKINLLHDRQNTKNVSYSSGRATNISGGSRPSIVDSQDFGRRTNIWTFNAGMMNKDDRTDHPAPFPEALARDHILSWSNEGDTVLDCFLGSGTTGKMAVKLNRNFIGIEIAQEYLAIAQKRITDAQMQLRLDGV